MENCPTGCREKDHMIKCFRCGAEYHIGIMHFCPTGCYYYQTSCVVKSRGFK